MKNFVETILPNGNAGFENKKNGQILEERKRFVPEFSDILQFDDFTLRDTCRRFSRG
jgi:hypothetical protein